MALQQEAHEMGNASQRLMRAVDGRTKVNRREKYTSEKETDRKETKSYSKSSRQAKEGKTGREWKRVGNALCNPGYILTLSHSWSRYAIHEARSDSNRQGNEFLMQKEEETHNG
jgi:hypothetical protein